MFSLVTTTLPTWHRGGFCQTLQSSYIVTHLQNIRLDADAENDAEVVRQINNLGVHANLVAYKCMTGAELQQLNFTG